MVIKCGSRQPLSFSHFHYHFVAIKFGSRQPLSFPHFYQIVEGGFEEALSIFLLSKSFVIKQ